MWTTNEKLNSDPLRLKGLEVQRRQYSTPLKHFYIFFYMSNCTLYFSK